MYLIINFFLKQKYLPYYLLVRKNIGRYKNNNVQNL